MSDFGELDAVAPLFLRAVPDVSVMVFTGELRIATVGGPVPIRDGLDASGISGRLVSEALAPKDWQSCEPLFRAALGGRSGSIEIEAVDRECWYRVNVEPLPETFGVGLAGACFWRDVTERKQLE